MTRFGTDGIRGRAGEVITAELAARVGRAVVRVLGPDVLLADDGRPSGPALVEALHDGVLAAGGAPRLCLRAPTPALSWRLAQGGHHAGVMVTASHNPATDNGLKVMDARGHKPDAAVRAAIERELAQPASPATARVATARPALPVAAEYVDALVATVRDATGRRTPLHGARIVVDCANGAAATTAPEVLRRLGAEVEAIGIGSGVAINDGCGALHPEVLARAVRACGATAGVALDGDGDRIVLVDAEGGVLDGDAILWLGATGLVADGRPPAAVVGTVMTNLGLERALAGQGIALVRTPVGDAEVAAAMDARGLPLGGEPSGHVLWTEGPPTADGLYAGLRALLPDPRTLRERLAGYRPCAQVHHALRITGPRPAVPAELVAAWEARGARMVVRPSGTEPVIRVMAEHEDPALARRAVDEVVAAMGSAAG